MQIAVWDTRQPAPEGFADRWTERLARCPQGNFSMEAGCLAWEAAHGRHALAALVDDGGRAGVLVLRRAGRELVCGQPWRWQAALASPPAREALVPGPETCAWLFAAASQVARPARLRMFLPAPARAGVAGFLAGGTLLVDLARDDEALLAGMDTNKRRAIKKAARDGWSVARAEGLDAMRTFHALQQEANTWRERAGEPGADAALPAAGEGWREWEHPWMVLLLAAHEGAIGAGSGFGWAAGGMIDYRTNASTAPGRKAGCNAQLAFEAMRLARGRGCRVMNWGGTTEFKREMGGERVAIHCWLGGGAAWAIPNRLDAGLANGRRVLAAWIKARRRPAAAKA